METILISVLTILVLLDVVLRIEKMKPKKQITKEEDNTNKKQEKITKAFNNLMEYDIDIAMRKDTE